MQQNGLLSHAQDLDAPLRLAAQRKINSYRQQHPDNQNISFLPGNQSDSFRFKLDALYQSLKSKVGLAAAKAAALRINLNVEGCGIAAAPVHAPARAPLLLPLLLSHNLPLPRIHKCVMGRLVHSGLGSSSLVAHVLHYSLPPREQLYSRYCSNTNTHTHGDTQSQSLAHKPDSSKASALVSQSTFLHHPPLEVLQ